MSAPRLTFPYGGGGGTVTGTGTPGKLAKFTGTGTSIGDSLLSESGTTITSAATAETFTNNQAWTIPVTTVGLAINGSKFVFDGNGLLGINIPSTPSTCLHVADGAGTGFAGSVYEGVRLQRATEALFSSSDGTRSFRAGLTGSTAVVGTSTAHDLLLQRGNVTALTLGASGVTFAGNLTSSLAQTWTLASSSTTALNIQSGLLNLDTTNSRVGVGTASPGAPLDVALAAGGGNNTARLIYTGALTANEGAVLGLGGYYTGTTATTFAYIKGAKDTITSGDYGGHLEFWTRPNGGSFAQQMTITSAGNVGIGTAAPAGKLAILHSATNPNGLASSTTIGALVLTNDGATAGSAYIRSAFLGSAAYDTGLQFGGYFYDGVSYKWTERMCIKGTGEVGIGTASPLWKNHTVGVGALFSGSAYNLAAVSQDQSTYRGISFGYDSSGQIGTIAATTGGAGSSLAFWTFSGAVWGERMRIDSTGNLILGAATGVSIQAAGTNQGLKLATTPGNTDPNTLDAYREGTRVLAAGDLSGWTYVTTTQYWTLVGRTVTLHTIFTGGASSATGGATIATPPLLTPLRIAAGAAVNSSGTALGNGVCLVASTSSTTGTVTTSNAISSSSVDKVITVTYETAGL